MQTIANETSLYSTERTDAKTESGIIIVHSPFFAKNILHKKSGQRTLKKRVNISVGEIPLLAVRCPAQELQNPQAGCLRKGRLYARNRTEQK